jgi:hypothetical protein
MDMVFYANDELFMPVVHQLASTATTEVPLNIIASVTDERQRADSEAKSRPSTPFVSRGRVPAGTKLLSQETHGLSRLLIIYH